ncbi:MAG: HAMP domain-containing sensor histidine kinase [Verrucomicrobiota bacterium]
MNVEKSTPSVQASRTPYRSSISLVGLYVGFAGTYVVVSTLLAGDLGQDQTKIELYKGLIFVAFTGVLLFFGARHLLVQISKQATEIERQRASIGHLDQRANLGLLASAIGHDANNLLTSVRMSIDLLQQNPPQAKQEKITETLSSVVEELAYLNNRLVRGGEAGQSGELKTLSLRNEIDRILQFIEDGHPIKGIELEITGSRKICALVNRHQFFQVVLNLLTNVARHAGPMAKAWLSLREESGRVVLSVKDNGPGVAPKDHQRIFEPYYSSHAEGAGLGLVSVRSIMRLHGGEIHCLESDNGGAHFELEFPALPASKSECANPRSCERISESPLTNSALGAQPST